MSDDIVAQLRAWSENAKEQGVGVVVDGLQAAADEIERLRAIVHNLDNATDRHPQRKQEDTTNVEHS